MARAHYQMAINNYNDRYIQSMKFYFEDSVKVNEIFCETKSVKENETEEQKRNFRYLSE